ncbi:hypothetical protein FisN_1Lh285 [Fistulifera solaris]|uniref:Uncharacterized protein n=1 Tax=Fistulifera solaris TaxID=1519565 RepID=A0A1Z5K495_FISSO|nr:hypothetical protein FisN_1Lh285 [Fistulifera solaris]|eukprot:GAX21043.1 hypothetical protein FisN_1Lh285 [Fistulifera solaris]
MKLTLVSTGLALLIGQSAAFAPLPRVSSSVATKPQSTTVCFEKTLEEEIEEMVQQELKKTKRMSNLRNERGIEYAPWMKITAEDEKEIRKVMRDKAEARRKRKEQETQVQGSLLRDSAFQELSGTGLKYKVIDGAVELEWTTGEESNTQGFIVKRRPAKTEKFEVLASYANYGPLQSKGSSGGVYRFLDDQVEPGGWVYRVTEKDKNGSENDLSQCLVEIQTNEEQMATKVAAIGFGVLAVAAVVAGALIDPLQ